MPFVLASSNRKGGCGKTSTVFHLGGELARRKARVLLLDCDPQASLSQSFLGSRVVEVLEPRRSIVALFDDRMDGSPASIIHETAYAGLHLVPATEPLTAFNHPDPASQGWLQDSLAQFLAEVERHYDYVLIDTPPNLQLLTWAALVAADGVLTPVVPEDYAAQGILYVKRFIELVTHSRNARLRWLGLLLCMVQPRLGIHKVYEQVMRDAYAELVLSTIVPQATLYKEAVSLKKPVSLHKPKHATAKTMATLLDEVLSRHNPVMKDAA